MSTNLNIGDRFPDLELPDHEGRTRRFSDFTQPGLMDKKLGFLDGYPLIVVFYRGYFCPRDKQQMKSLVQLQQELRVSYAQMVTISVEASGVQAAYRAGLGAQWTFLSDQDRALVKQINILDETEGEIAYVAQPYTFVLQPDLAVHKIYNGWFYVDRPTSAELLLDLRAITASFSNHSYEAYHTPEVEQIRIPQQTWSDGAPALGAGGLPVAEGMVRHFNTRSGHGIIEHEGQEIFFNFTAIPGQGYRTIDPGTAVKFELVENKTGLTARNIQRI